MGEQLEMPQELSGTILQTMYDKAALAAMPLEKRINYISKTMSRNDELNSRAEMIEDALQEGYAKGRDEGLAEGRADAAKRMVASGMTKEQVAAILQLSANELDTLFGS
jgi:predicted transposase/invertase (TIGR01784 family)